MSTDTDTDTLSPEEAAQYLPEALRRPPIFDLLNATDAGKRQLQLIRTRVAKGATDSEVAQFLELCAQYSLDWNADEAWCAVSNPDDPHKRRVLLMVGRNGLRKIAQRQGLDFDGDVVRAKDTFRAERKPDGTRDIIHIYEEGEDDDARGVLRGAWAEVFEVKRDGSRGRQRGYFYARITEYKPKSEKALQYSPWGAQESVMMLTAAERQALGQATPLGGIVGQGELDRGNELAAALELTAGNGGEEVHVDLPPEVEAVVSRAKDLGHAGLANRGTVAMTIEGRGPEGIELFIATASRTLDAFEQSKAAAKIDTDTAPPQDPPEVEVVPPDAEAIQAMREDAERLEEEAENARAAGRDEDSEALFAEAASLRAEAAAAEGDPGATAVSHTESVREKGAATAPDDPA